jgi:hypothetical protein
LTVLLGTLLVPSVVLYQMLRLKRRAHRLSIRRTPRGNQPLTMPYVDINPHKGRPKWVGYAILAILLVLTSAVVATALATTS